MSSRGDRFLIWTSSFAAKKNFQHFLVWLTFQSSKLGMKCDNDDNKNIFWLFCCSIETETQRERVCVRVREAFETKIVHECKSVCVASDSKLASSRERGFRERERERERERGRKKINFETKIFSSKNIKQSWLTHDWLLPAGKGVKNYSWPLIFVALSCLDIRPAAKLW